MDNIIDWLNDEPRQGPVMQRDGAYALLSWRDIRDNAHAPVIDLRGLMWLTLLVVGLPVLLMV
jgi:hypothetical protein